MKRAILVTTALAVVLMVAGPAAAQVAPSEPATTTTLPPLVTIPPADQSSPGLFDVSGHVREAVDDWFTSLVTSALNPALSLLGRSLLSAPDVTEQGEVRTIWAVTLGIADTMFVLLALLGGVTVMTHETLQSRYSAKEILPRLVLAVIAANASLLVASEAIHLANALAQAFLGAGLDPDVAVGGLGRAVLATVGSGGLFILLGLVATVMALILVCIYLARAVLVVVLVVAAPLALACHALPQTERIAQLWWRAMTACLIVQVAQALVLVTAVRVFFAPDSSNVIGLSAGDGLVSLLVTLCLLFVMIKIPSWAERVVFGGSGGPVRATTGKAVVAARMAVAKV